MKRMILQLAAMLVLTCLPSICEMQELTISDGTGDSFTIDQNGNIVASTGIIAIAAGNISVDGAGFIDITSNISGTVKVGSFKINSAQAFGLGDSISPQLQDEESVITSAGAGVLTILYTDTTYSDLSSELLLAGSESTANIPETIVNFVAYGDNGVEFPATTNLGGVGPLSGSNDNAGTVVSNPFTGPSTSLSSQTTITFQRAGTFNTTFDLATPTMPTPEPGSFVLFTGSSLLLGVTGFLRRRV